MPATLHLYEGIDIVIENGDIRCKDVVHRDLANIVKTENPQSPVFGDYDIHLAESIESIGSPWFYVLSVEGDVSNTVEDRIY